MALTVSKSKTVSINLAVGSILFYPGGLYEFKSCGTFENVNRGNKQEAESTTKKETIDPILITSKNKISSLLSPKEDSKEYGHLSDFLKSQIQRQKQLRASKKDTSSKGTSNNNRYNNALIEKAAKDIRDKKKNA